MIKTNITKFGCLITYMSEVLLLLKYYALYWYNLVGRIIFRMQ